MACGSFQGHLLHSYELCPAMSSKFALCLPRTEISHMSQSSLDGQKAPNTPAPHPHTLSHHQQQRFIGRDL